MQEKIRALLDRFREVEELLGTTEVHADQKLYKQLAQEHAYLSEVKTIFENCNKYERQLEDNRQLLKEESDPELLEMVRQESPLLEQALLAAKSELENLLVPPDPRDHRPILLELRAGTGGDEAAIFVGDCVRMYKYYADKMGWKVEALSSTPSEMGGFKEYVMSLAGHNVFRFMQYEAGVHRVQRVPKTEAQGRVHTSAITVAVLLEPEEGEEVIIDEKDLKIDTYRASGAGGQHVNVTDSAVRITHLPTGTVVTCQDERSQHKNKDKAMRLLSAKIGEELRRKANKEMADTRASQVGTGDRSERSRTYNFPQNRVTDHRIDLTLYKLDRVMQGDLSDFTEALVKHFHQEKLSA